MIALDKPRQGKSAFKRRLRTNNAVLLFARSLNFTLEPFEPRNCNRSIQHDEMCAKGQGTFETFDGNFFTYFRSSF